MQIHIEIHTNIYTYIYTYYRGVLVEASSSSARLALDSSDTEGLSRALRV